LGRRNWGTRAAEHRRFELRDAFVIMLAFHATLGAATTAYCDAAAGLQIGKTKPGQNGVRASFARVARIK